MTKRIGRNPTRAEREHLDKLGLQSSDWLIVVKREWTWLISHRFVGQAKEVRGERWV